MPEPPVRSADLVEEAGGLRIGERLAQIRKSKGPTLARLSAMTSIEILVVVAAAGA